MAQGDALVAAAGFHVVAPDLRGYGRTAGWSADYDADLRPFRLLNAVRDTLGLAFALGYRRPAAVVGHDFGAIVAAWCALVRPDVFGSLALMSAPFAGPPGLPFDIDRSPPVTPGARPSMRHLAALPRPRKHYQWYYSTRPANAQMWHCGKASTISCAPISTTRAPIGRQNRPRRLASWSAAELAKMPTYYIMDLADDMATTVAKEMPSARRDRGLQMAARQRTRRLRRRIPAQRLPGRAELVSNAAPKRTFDSELQLFSGSHDRRAVHLHLRQERLGRLSAARRARAHAGEGLHPDGRLPSARRRRALGPAGTAGSSECVADRFSMRPGRRLKRAEWRRTCFLIGDFLGSSSWCATGSRARHGSSHSRRHCFDIAKRHHDMELVGTARDQGARFVVRQQHPGRTLDVRQFVGRRDQDPAGDVGQDVETGVAGAVDRAGRGLHRGGNPFRIEPSLPVAQRQERRGERIDRGVEEERGGDHHDRRHDLRPFLAEQVVTEPRRTRRAAAPSAGSSAAASRPARTTRRWRR